MTNPSASSKPQVYPGPFFVAIGIAIHHFFTTSWELALASGYDPSRPLPLSPERIALVANLATNLAGVAQQIGYERAARDVTERGLERDAEARARQRRLAAAVEAAAVEPPAPRRRLSPAYGYRAMAARFASDCAGCRGRIRSGDSIVWHGGDRAAWHDGCSPERAWNLAAVSAAPVPVEPVRATDADLAPIREVIRAERAERTATSSTVEPELAAIATSSRLQQVQARETYTAPVARIAPIEALSPVALRSGELVAGAAAEGHGVLTGWQGSGERTRAELIEALAAVGMPESWAPASKSAHRHAGLAVLALNAGGYVARAEKRQKGSRLGERTGSYVMDGYRRVDVTVAARWTVMAVRPGGAAGEAAGRNVLIVELHSDGSLVLDPTVGAESLAESVRVEFSRCKASEVYQAGEVTDWLRGILIGRYGAVRLGGNWYVPRKAGFENAERLCSELARGWGVSWMLPALPIATSDQLRAGLARGLAAEVTALIDELSKAREVARAAGREDIGPSAAARYLTELKTIAARVKSYSEVIGAEHLTEVKAQAERLVGELDGLADGTSQRGALLEWDFTAEVPADGGWSPRER